MANIDILNIPIQKINKKQFLGLIISKIKKNEKLQIVTINPEMLVLAQKEKKFKKILKQTFNIPDGVGILWAGYFLSKAKQDKNLLGLFKKLFWFKISLILIPFWRKKFKVFEKLSGSDIFWDIMELAHKKSLRVFLLGAEKGIAKIVASKVKNKFLNLRIVGAMSGSAKEQDDKKMQKIINSKKPHIIFVAYGAPKQEYWIARNLSYFDQSAVVVGVGGTFDFIAGKVKRAPKILQNLGLEWFWRLILEPKKRLKRIFNAIVVFPIKVLQSLF